MWQYEDLWRNWRMDQAHVRQHALQLLAIRHAYLDQVYYQKEYACRREILAKIKILVGTGAKISEGRAGLTSWPRIFPEGSIIGSVVDEYQQQAVEIGTLMMRLRKLSRPRLSLRMSRRLWHTK